MHSTLFIKPKHSWFLELDTFLNFEILKNSTFSKEEDSNIHNIQKHQLPRG
jgi:hypothetical protein